MSQDNNNSRWKTIIVSSLMTLLVAVVSSYLTYYWGLTAQIRLNDYQSRQKAYSKLIGENAIISQLYVSRFESYINSDYHEFRWKLNGSPKDSINQKEALRWMKKSEDQAIELAREKQILFETVELINALFPYTKKLEDLSDKIYHHPIPKIKRPKNNWSLEELKTYKDSAVKQTQDFVQVNISKPIDELASYLKTQVHDDF
jgi:hypothetical protein